VPLLDCCKKFLPANCSNGACVLEYTYVSVERTGELHVGAGCHVAGLLDWTGLLTGGAGVLAGVGCVGW
jgi:hypothetical protein